MGGLQYDGNSDWTCPVLIKHGSNVYVFGRLPKDNPNSENLNDWGFNKLSNNTGITFPAPTSQPIKIKKSTLPSTVTEEIATKKYHVKYDGIKYYAYPPETAQGQYSLKTDIYTAVDRITQIFNAEDSQKLIAFEATSPDKTQKAITTQCTLNNSVQFPNPGNNLNLKDLTQKFLNRMQDNDPEKRPYSDEALRFFTTLHILCLACETNNQLHQIYLQEVKNTYCAKLILLANGYWTQKINSTNPSTKTAQTIDQTFENYDFASHPKVCNAIIQLFTSNLLTKDIAILIAQNTEQAENLAKTINILSNYKYLSKDILTFVTQNTENAKSLIKVITTLDKKGLLTPAITTQLLGSLIPALAQTKLTYTANNFLRALFLVCNSNNPLLLNKEMIDKMWANYNSIDGNTLSEDAAKLFIFKCAYVLDYKKHSYNRSSFFSKTKHKNSTEDVSTLNVTMDTITQQAAKKPRSRTASIWKQLPATRLAQATITIKPPFNLLAVVPEA